MTKKVYIPGYIKADGTVIKGHYRTMTESKKVRSIAALLGWKNRKRARA